MGSRIYISQLGRIGHDGPFDRLLLWDGERHQYPDEPADPMGHYVYFLWYPSGMHAGRVQCFCRCGCSECGFLAHSLCDCGSKGLVPPAGCGCLHGKQLCGSLVGILLCGVRALLPVSEEGPDAFGVLHDSQPLHSPRTVLDGTAAPYVSGNSGGCRAGAVYSFTEQGKHLYGRLRRLRSRDGCRCRGGSAAVPGNCQIGRLDPDPL